MNTHLYSGLNKTKYPQETLKSLMGIQYGASTRKGHRLIPVSYGFAAKSNVLSKKSARENRIC